MTAGRDPAGGSGGRPMGSRLLQVGLGIVVIGFAVVIYSWGAVAGLDNLALQMPYLVSGGMFGLGLVFCGLAVVLVSVVQQASVARDRELQELRGALHQMAELLNDAPGAVPSTAEPVEEAS